MGIESSLRDVLVVIAGVVGVVWTVNLARTGASLDVLYSQREGLGMLLATRVPLLVAMICVGRCLSSPGSMAWAEIPLPLALRWLGAAAAALGAALFAWVLASLGRGFSMSLVVRTGGELVTRGPYRWVRHPMYLALCLLIAGFAVATGNVLAAAAGALMLAVAMNVRIRREEAVLVDHFGDAYRRYMARTPRFLPAALGVAVSLSDWDRARARR